MFFIENIFEKLILVLSCCQEYLNPGASPSWFMLCTSTITNPVTAYKILSQSYFIPLCQDETGNLLS